MADEFCVYILTNKSHTTLYTGMTSSLSKRIWEHKNNVIAGFTSRYKLHYLVYIETADTLEAALLREHQIKAGSRQKKIDLINCLNPKWKDLTDEFCSLG